MVSRIRMRRVLKRIMLLVFCVGLLMCIFRRNNVQRRRKFILNRGLVTHNRLKLGLQVTRDNNNTVLSNKTILIFVAYMRSGSSFTSLAFQDYLGSFYLFEPIRSVWELFRDCPENSSVKLNYIGGIERFYKKNEEDDVILEELRHMMTCRFERLSLQTLTDKFHGFYTKIMKRVETCIEKEIKPIYFPIATTNESLSLLGQEFRTKCLHYPMGRCQNSELLVMKYIRLSMRTIEKLLPLFPNLKVIHLNRDPRGMFHSKMNLKEYRHEVTPIEIRRHCKNWADDVIKSKELSTLYPDQVMIMKYEVVANAPEREFQTICNFTGVPYNSVLKRRVKFATAANHEGCHFCVERLNSSVTAASWRESLDFVTARYLYTKCETGNKLLNYLPFDNEDDMRNLSLPFFL